MMHLLAIEWKKLRHYKLFLILLGAYIVIYFLAILALKDMIPSEFRVATDQILSFPHIWYWVAFLGKFINYMLCLVVIVIITNEYNYNTLRQNVIDGLSREEVVTAKFLVVLVLSIMATLLAFLLVCGFGLFHSEGLTGESVFSNIQLLGLHFIQTMAILSFAAFTSFLLRRMGLTFVVFVPYVLFVEAIIRNLLASGFDSFSSSGFTRYFPSRSIHSTVPWPDQVYNFSDLTMGLQDKVFPVNLSVIMVTLLYTGLFIGLSYYLVRQRDMH